MFLTLRFLIIATQMKPNSFDAVSDASILI
jgi:hypothetical protein